MIASLSVSTIIAIVFVLGYACIALEHRLRVDKAAPALLTGMLVWSFIMLFPESVGLSSDPAELSSRLYGHLSKTAGVIFFLLAAMTVVELMDAHGGFQIVTDRITTTDRRRLLWLVGTITFVLSSVLDNLTTAIVIAVMLRRLVADRDDRRTYAGLVVVAANAGGAWSPIGDVTTIMLWIGGQVSTWNIVVKTLAPSIVCLLVATLWLSRTMRGRMERPEPEDFGAPAIPAHQRATVLVLGLCTLLGVPLFKQLMDLPPFMGILFGLGILWGYTELAHGRNGERSGLQVAAVLRRIDHASILFFLGILIAVAGLETAGLLEHLAAALQAWIPDLYALNAIIGVLSAIVDNVPLVAAAQGMYPLDVYPMDHVFWELLALCAGTGGSMLIIGSAAGIAVMGVTQIDFGWYVRRVTPAAALGYAGALATFWLCWSRGR